MLIVAHQRQLVKFFRNQSHASTTFPISLSMHTNAGYDALDGPKAYYQIPL
jgi:hypothetical protein